MLKIKLLRLHEFELVLLYNGHFLRAPTDFRLRVLQNTGYILVINIYYWTQITCTENSIGKSINTKVIALRKASPGSF